MNQIISIAAGATHVLESPSPSYSLPHPLTITALPGSGGTLAVASQTAYGGAWTDWDEGAVSAATTAKLDGPVYALRFTAATEPGAVEVAA
jgi:hypothetical protein